MCRDIRVLWLLWQLGVAQWRARGLGGDLGALPVSSSWGLHILVLMQALVSLSDSILVSLPLCFKLEHFIIYVYLCNSRIHVITQYSGYVCVYYASMLRCWHLVWILVRTDHPCLGVGCHMVGAGSVVDADQTKRWSLRISASVPLLKSQRIGMRNLSHKTLRTMS
jgi:hypothetical protein